MISEMNKEQQMSMRSLMQDPRFKTFLTWLEESREKTHQRMYITVDPNITCFLQGEAKTLFDVITKSYAALDVMHGPAIPHEPETPYGG